MMGIALSMASNPLQITVIQQAIAVLRRFGTDAHVYLPGVGMINGLQAGNYLDSAGTTQGTVDQPVGLVLDAAGSLGVNMIPNSGFDTSAGWGVSQPTSGSVTVDGGLAVINSIDGSYCQVFRNDHAGLGFVVGRSYRLDYVVTAASGAGGRVNIGGVTGVAITAPGAYFHIATITDMSALLVARAGIGSISLDSLIVREVTGVAASQPTTASKPILRRGAVNLLTYSGDFSNAAWTPSNISISGTRFTRVGTGSSESPLVRNSNGPAVTVGSNYTFAAIAKVGTAENKLYLRDLRCESTGQTTAEVITTFDLSTGEGASGSLHIGKFSSVAIGNGLFLCVINGTASATPPANRLDIGVTSSGVIGGTSGDYIDVYGSALFAGTYTAAQIQALGGIPLTTTAPASTALGPQYWQFDGSNDSLSLGGPLFQMGDDHCVVAGALSESATGDRAIFSQRSSAATNPIVCGVDVSSGSPRAIWRDDAGLISILSGTAVSGAIIVSARSVANARVFRVNAVQKQAATLSLGSTAITSASIGVSPSASPVAYFSGSIFPVIAIKGTVTDPDLLLLEKFVGQLSGVQI